MQKVTIICSSHGKFDQSPNVHVSRAAGCPRCQLCPSCLLFRTLQGRLCSYCKPYPQNKLYRKTKEMEIVHFLKDSLPDYPFIHNKSVSTDCTNTHLFPDILFDCGHFNLIVEVDEHQHRGASYSCDRQRMYDIIAKLNMPCIFVRYNPDSAFSNKDILLDKVYEYLSLADFEPEDLKGIWDDYGFAVEYLFYSN